EEYGSALILGYGRSGRAAERLLQAEGCQTRVLARELAGDPEVAQLLAENTFDVCVVSPGFSVSSPWVCAVRDSGVPLISELELGWSRHRGKTVAVTGSNGKSTAVKWICELLQAAGKKAAIGGNYGIPACETVLDQPDLEWLVLEVSSFQLETVRDFSADVAVLLNLLPNHLDRHGTMACYRGAKARIFGAVASGACVVPVDLLDSIRDLVPGTRDWITFGDSPSADYCFSNGHVSGIGGATLDLSATLFESPILGACTGAAVAAVAVACGIDLAFAESAARSFRPLPHRLERLGEIDGVVYVDDSKATNLAAMAAALAACGENIHLIAGGLPKESDYTFVKEILAQRVRSIYVIGQASGAMFQAWSGVCPCVECGTLEEAFGAATRAARAGETVLLSPGCASFDQFGSFEERGDCFKKLFIGQEHATNGASSRK
ncbi:UDP-N-acetylmuramoyl-L-alanine--D-glutamate ligase, partial [Pontiella sp.]|uniref:UDP-N-acetylmuramoyl-L-alanine--D-glutamate ligase n=1 Tax=Pontiella sp. TaxID=2837462 RepID=UPI003563E318